MHHSFKVILGALALVSSTPTSPPPTYSAIPQLARFENDQNATPLVAANPVNIYLDIFFKGWQVFTAGVGGAPATGVLPQSPPNQIASGPLTPATLLQGTPALTTVYQDTTIDRFDFFSFFYGCVLATQETVAGAPEPCTVTVTGLDKNGRQVAQQSFDFVANALSEQMNKATLVGFTGLQTATFSVTSKALGTLPENARVALVGDTFNYTVFSQNPISP